MNIKLHPAVAAVIIIIALAVTVGLVFKLAGPREDGAKTPVDMGKFMGGPKPKAPTPPAKK